MDAFESIVATLLERDGFWVRTLFKVALTRDEKRDIGRHSTPRWELDVVAYRPGDNLLRVVECKSFLDSCGVRRAAFDPSTNASKRYKLFNEPLTKDIVFGRLKQQLLDLNAIRPDPHMELCLAAGKIVKSDADAIRSHFDMNGWKLFDSNWLLRGLRDVAADGYDNTVAAITAKLLLRQST